MPSSLPFGPPAIIRASAAFASPVARSSRHSDETVQRAIELSMRSRQDFVSSTGESFFAAICAAASAIVGKPDITAPPD